jgi:RNA polymerase nonessential primary-like sigma factor
MNKIKKTINALEHKLERNPTDQEIAEVLDIPVQYIDMYQMNRATIHSLDETVSNDETESSLLDIFLDPRDNNIQKTLPDFHVLREESSQSIFQILENILSPKEIFVLKEYYIKEKSFDEIACMLETTPHATQKFIIYTKNKIKNSKKIFNLLRPYL